MIDNINQEQSPAPDTYKLNDYTILFNKKLGGGAFGRIYSCINNKTKEIFACKIEKPDIETPQLSNEYKILNLLKNYLFFPKCYKFCSSPHGQPNFRSFRRKFRNNNVKITKSKIFNEININDNNTMFRKIKRNS